VSWAVHEARRSVVSCACGPVGTQVRSGLPSVGVESSLPLSYTCHVAVHIQMAMPASGHEEQEPSKLCPSRTAARLLFPVVHEARRSDVSCPVHVVR
jgi:hypothetical protein